MAKVAMEWACNETYGGAAVSNGTFFTNAPNYPYIQCNYVGGGSYFEYYMSPIASSGGGMTDAQLSLLVFAVLMVIFALGVGLGFKFTHTTRYTGDA